MEVINNVQQNRFEFHIDRRIAKIIYEIKNDKYYLVSTQVPKELSGQGIGSKLIKETLEQIENMGFKVVANCPFIQAWFKRHPEKAYLQADS